MTFRPSIEAANDFAPAHSRIFKEVNDIYLMFYDTPFIFRNLKMILIASTSKPLSYTAKGTVRRGAILRDYAQEIDAIYKAVEESSSTNVPVPTGSSSEGGWTTDESLQFVHGVIHCIMKGAEAMGDDDDIFGFGCDR